MEGDGWEDRMKARSLNFLPLQLEMSHLKGLSLFVLELIEDGQSVEGTLKGERMFAILGTG